MTTTKTPKSASTALAQNAAHNGALVMTSAEKEAIEARGHHQARKGSYCSMTHSKAEGAAATHCEARHAACICQECREGPAHE